MKEIVKTKFNISGLKNDISYIIYCLKSEKQDIDFNKFLPVPEMVKARGNESIWCNHNWGTYTTAVSSSIKIKTVGNGNKQIAICELDTVRNVPVSFLRELIHLCNIRCMNIEGVWTNNTYNNIGKFNNDKLNVELNKVDKLLIIKDIYNLSNKEINKLKKNII